MHNYIKALAAQYPSVIYVGILFLSLMLDNIIIEGTYT